MRSVSVDPAWFWNPMINRCRLVARSSCLVAFRRARLGPGARKNENCGRLCWPSPKHDGMLRRVWKKRSPFSKASHGVVRVILRDLINKNGVRRNGGGSGGALPPSRACAEKFFDLGQNPLTNAPQAKRSTLFCIGRRKQRSAELGGILTFGPAGTPTHAPPLAFFCFFANVRPGSKGKRFVERFRFSIFPAQLVRDFPLKLSFPYYLDARFKKRKLCRQNVNARNSFPRCTATFLKTQQSIVGSAQWARNV